ALRRRRAAADHHPPARAAEREWREGVPRQRETQAGPRPAAMASEREADGVARENGHGRTEIAGTLAADEGLVAFRRLCDSVRTDQSGRRVARGARSCATAGSPVGLPALPDRADAVELLRERRSQARRGAHGALDLDASGGGDDRRAFTVASPPERRAAPALRGQRPESRWIRPGGRGAWRGHDHRSPGKLLLWEVVAKDGAGKAVAWSGKQRFSVSK